MFELFGDQFASGCFEIGEHFRSRFTPPLRPAQIFLKKRKTLGRQMHARKHFAHACAFFGRYFDNAFAFKTVGNGKRLAFDV